MTRNILLLLLFLAALSTFRGEEPSRPTVREQLRTKIMETFPLALAAKPAGDVKHEEQAVLYDNKDVTPVLVMAPFIISESKLLRDLATVMARTEQEKRAEHFSVLEGGTIGNIAGMQVGSWWTPDRGWTFLRLNKTRSIRQNDAMEARAKELQELLMLTDGHKPGPLPKQWGIEGPGARQGASNQ